MSKRRMIFRFLLQRLLALVIILGVLLFATFGMVRMIPGDPAVFIAGADASQAQVQEVRQSLELDRPFNVQLGDQLARLSHLDLGRSFRTNQPVTSIIAQRLPLTLTVP